MGESASVKEFELPLHLQLAMRRAELEAKELTWDQLYAALLNLYHQRLLEMQAIKDMMQDENIELEFDIPSDIELTQLAMTMMAMEDDDDDDFEGLDSFMNAMDLGDPDPSNHRTEFKSVEDMAQWFSQEKTDDWRQRD
jgi:hypothetical protein